MLALNIVSWHLLLSEYSLKKYKENIKGGVYDMTFDLEERKVITKLNKSNKRECFILNEEHENWTDFYYLSFVNEICNNFGWKQKS